MKLGNAFDFVVPLDPQLFNIITGLDLDVAVEQIVSLIAAAAPIPAELHTPASIEHNVLAAIYQDDDAHDTCSLTACLNPLHPGPCKGWKGTLHEVSPGAWHAIEAARVEKANASRIKKIEALKSAGKPIPHKLLQPIVAKAHPNAGQTAKSATGEAHAAGKAVSDAAGIVNDHPGKVTLGQATKNLTPGPPGKGPKNKKPTLASKGVAFVISQPKVTDQYKLDKAAAITPEQWSQLSSDDKSVIRGELGKVQKDGFGPQQKKATELLAKLPGHGTPAKTVQDLSPAPEKAVTVDKAKVADLLTKAKETPPKVEVMHEPKGPVTTHTQGAAMKAVGEAVFGEMVQSASNWATKVDQLKAKGPLEDQPGFKNYVNSVAQAALKKATAGQMPDNPGITVFNHQIRDHILEGKPGLPPVLQAMVDNHKSVLEGNGPLPSKAETPAPALASDEAVGKLSDALKKAAPPKPLPKHVTDAIAMAKGKAPGASWSKNHLAAYQPLSAEEFHALPQDVKTTIISELTKGQSKFLDPKKVAASKALVEKFTAKAPKIENGAAKAPVDVSLATHLHDHSITHAQASKAIKDASVSDLFKVAKQTADVSNLENPDATGYLTSTAEEDAKALVKKHIMGVGLHPDDGVLKQPQVKGAAEALHTAALMQSYAQQVQAAKNHAYAKIAKKLAADQGELSPLQEMALQQYGKHLLLHATPPSSAADIDKLKATTKAAENALSSALLDAVKKANAPAAGEMSNAQIADRAAELLGKNAFPHTAMSLSELKLANQLGKDQADQEAKQFPDSVLSDPAVAAKLGAYTHALTQLLASQQQIHNLQEHIKTNHQQAILSGKDQHGVPMTVADKQVLAKHVILLGQSHSHLGQTLEHQEAKLPETKAQFLAAADKALGNLKSPEPTSLTEYDQAAVGEAYSTAWGKAASKATTYGIKSYTDTAKMKAHNEYPAFTQNLGDLKALAGKLAVAHAHEHTAHLNVPTDPDTGALEPGPQLNEWAAATKQRQAIEAQFNSLHKTAQGRLDMIRTAAGLKKRALPKIDSPAVKTSAAEAGFYKTAVYGAPNYGKAAKAKNYMLAKAGPKIAVVHKSPSDKVMEKLGAPPKTPATPANLPPMPAPKQHVKPPSSLAGNPNPEAAASQGYHYTEKVGAADSHGWSYGDGAAYVSSPAELKALQEHLAKGDTKFGIEAQKQFKWSINNMEGKGAASSGKNALYSYTGSSYTNINAKLNSLPPGTKKTGSSTVSSIDAAFAASPPLEGDVVLYRGFSNPEGVFKSGKWNDVNVAGMEWSQRSYSSTSGSLETARGFAGHGGVLMRVIVPKELGVKGINAKGGQHAGENEVILQRGLRYRVVADYGKHNGRRYIDVMVVPNPYDQPE